MKRQLLLTIAALCPAFAQNGAIPAAIGYTAPAAFQAAPGQVVTLFLHGIPPAADGTFRSAQAAAGIAVHINQAKSSPVQAAIFAVRQEDECGQTGALDPACLLTSIKAQLPFELLGDLVHSDQTNNYSYQPPAQIGIDVDGRAGRAFPLQPLPDNGHVLTTCDASWDTATSSVCDRQVYHSDGSLVTRQAPAKIGETVFVLYYGLGKTAPAVPTGQPSPAGAAATDILPNSPRVTLGIQPNFLNTPSSLPRTAFNADWAKTIPVPIVSAALLPGQVGIFQVNFTIPAADSIYPCGDDVRSNSLLLAATSQGVEGIGLCLQQ